MGALDAAAIGATGARGAAAGRLVRGLRSGAGVATAATGWGSG
ncbi:hypothetical protein VITFI_CDS2627 [Vitreoscilla filiformis]|uniref:Uncharacterized protein n=1 Tax=Vitreoscilla filiformis TaxID=63 RepID=A0A221KH81_VITFI|nr:hypothetical protein VITFI_CDS2627 [Vitreoscilla filiformis]